MRLSLTILLILCSAAGCQNHPREPIVLAPEVDIARFMGNWYVIANIPTPFEKRAWNAVERYHDSGNGYIATTFTYNRDSFDGPEKRYNARGFVREGSNGAVWGMQFLWPFRADYRVMHLDEDYGVTIIGREKRDFLWIMARTPTIPETELNRLLEICREAGYDLSELRLVPQQPLAERG